MKKCILFFAAIWMTLCFCSCDDGRIYEKEVNIQRGGRAMKLTGRFSGISNWTDDYSVVVAGYNEITTSQCSRRNRYRYDTGRYQ